MIDLYNDNCLNILDNLVNKNIIIDTIIVDPPYNISYNDFDWDKNFDIEKAIFLCSKLLKVNGNFLMFQGWSNVCETKQIMDKYFTIKDWIIYDRIKGRGTTKSLVSTREDILWYTNGDNYTFNKIYSNIPKVTGGLGLKNGELNRALTNVWSDISPIVPWSSEKVNHPTQKPIELMKCIVTIWSNTNDTILDFTMGSGSTGVACKLLRRNFIGIEINKEYFNIAQKRINDTIITKKLF